MDGEEPQKVTSKDVRRSRYKKKIGLYYIQHFHIRYSQNRINKVRYIFVDDIAVMARDERNTTTLARRLYHEKCGTL